MVPEGKWRTQCLPKGQFSCLLASEAQNSKEWGIPSPGFAVGPVWAQLLTAGLSALRIGIEFLTVGFADWDMRRGPQEARVVHKTPANVGKANMHLFGGDSLKFHELAQEALDLPKVKNLSSEKGMTTCTRGPAFPEVTKELSVTRPFPFCVKHFCSLGGIFSD